MRTKPNCVAIVQARLSSTRLPGKVLASVATLEILGHVLERLSVCRNIDSTTVATTLNRADDRLWEYLEQRFPWIGRFRGCENDVLDRYLMAARAAGADTVVRVTSDSPLIDPAVVDAVVAVQREGGYDYVSNSLSPSLPDGLDAECFTMPALIRAWESAKSAEEREHVTAYIRMHPEDFRLANVSWQRNLSGFCWAVDTAADLNFVRALADHMDLRDPRNYGFQRVLAVLKSNPEVAAINPDAVRDQKLLEQMPEIFTAHGENFDRHPLILEPY